MGFTKATKKQAKLRLALVGPAGSGKTYSALAIAQGLGGRVAVLDTEHGSASKYADRFDFDADSLSTFAPERYVRAIKEAAAGGYGVLILDSLSHAWNGTGGVLEIVDAAGARARGNTYAGWKEGTPQQNALIEAILQAPLHIIATMRAKTEYALEKDERGRTAPRKVGLAPVQRDGVEYEFDVVGLLDADHWLTVDKTRCPDLTGGRFHRPGADLGKTLAAWLSDGVAERMEEPRPASAPTILPTSAPAVEVLPPVADVLQPGEAYESAFAQLRGAKTVNQLQAAAKGMASLKDALKPELFEDLRKVYKEQLATLSAQAMGGEAANG